MILGKKKKAPNITTSQVTNYISLDPMHVAKIVFSDVTVTLSLTTQF